ncbi:SDR family NAD(P)-dependent oxidoreductase [Sphingomonas naphthae]|uniref:SDR family NAD(P)-dependent oxidoreductase n=1 Tax=Sphingomonas naphthae TaxID=1813468 RepID=A0ABY7TGK1_9SPHN|nr:SDR family NAD(P)-dependent oxidoreductase [Sphingomonas naphthae]WCT72193.1 SDR family NAD(P)-dependent oxidoreductase [Sphingomonas naphthae]
MAETQARLDGKVALVTGAGRRRSIGRAIAMAFADAGAAVALIGTGRDPDTFPDDEKARGWRDIDSVADEIVSRGGTATTIVADIADPADSADAIAQTIARLGRLDILVNNAGAARGADRGPAIDLPFDEWRRVHRVNVDGTFLMAQAAGRAMIDRAEGGAIVNISSVASRLANAGTAAYASSKAAMNTLSRVLAMELAPHAIRVNAILPGIVDTARVDDLGRGERWQEFLRGFSPMGRAGDAQDIAALCLFLCGDQGRWITGQDIAVDGGSTWH